MENKEILTLIERGFKPETISSEFNIPYAQIQKALLEKERNAAKRETEMDKMRKKYFDIYAPEDKKAKFELPSAEQLASYMKVDGIIDGIEEKVKVQMSKVKKIKEKH